MAVYGLHGLPAEQHCRQKSEYRLSWLHRPRTTMRPTTAPSSHSTTVRAVMQCAWLNDVRQLIACGASTILPPHTVDATRVWLHCRSANGEVLEAGRHDAPARPCWCEHVHCCRRWAALLCHVCISEPSCMPLLYSTDAMVTDL